jgi:hypothetical protein
MGGDFVSASLLPNGQSTRIPLPQVLIYPSDALQLKSELAC